MGESKIPMIIVVAVIAVVVAIIAVICTSFSDLQFYEYGFKRSKTTREVDTTKVYSSGRHWIGPAADFKAFDATIHHIDMDATSIFTSADKLEIVIDLDIYYFLVKEDLPDLHDEYDLKYHGIIYSAAQDAVKSTGGDYKLEDYYAQREVVEKALIKGLQERLSGTCECQPRCEENPCVSGTPCLDRTNCSVKQRGLFVDVRYVQLTDIKIPSDVEERNLRALVLTEETEKEKYVLEAAVVTKETERQVSEILNEAAERSSEAQANATLIAAQSTASYTKLLEEARRTGLKTLFSSLNFTGQDFKSSFDYLRSLSGFDKAHLTVGYDQIIVGPTNSP